MPKNNGKARRARRQMVAESRRPCAYVLDGHDTDGTPWHECTVHGELAISPDAPCSEYRAPRSQREV